MKRLPRRCDKLLERAPVFQKVYRLAEVSVWMRYQPNWTAARPGPSVKSLNGLRSKPLEVLADPCQHYPAWLTI